MTLDTLEPFGMRRLLTFDVGQICPYIRVSILRCLADVLNLNRYLAPIGVHFTVKVKYRAKHCENSGCY